MSTTPQRDSINLAIPAMTSLQFGSRLFKLHRAAVITYSHLMCENRWKRRIVNGSRRVYDVIIRRHIFIDISCAL